MPKKTLTIFIFCILLTITGCVSEKLIKTDTHPPSRHFSTLAEKTSAEKQFAVYDPAEKLNKHVYAFNARIDRYFLIPVVNAYTIIVPGIIRHGVVNFFSNISEATNFTNAVLQVKPDKAATAFGRFTINSTLGLLGTIDIAGKLGLQQQQEDFGETLGHWGASTGPYIMLPFVGPSNMRDAIGTAVDYSTLTALVPNDIRDTTEYNVVAYSLQPINARYHNHFRYYASGSPFEYEMVRYIVTKSRAIQIEKNK